MEIYSENNFVKLGGVVASGLELSHEIYGEKFYRFYIEIDRLSGMSDKIPVIISERLIDIEDYKDVSVKTENPPVQANLNRRIF